MYTFKLFTLTNLNTLDYYIPFLYNKKEYTIGITLIITTITIVAICLYIFNHVKIHKINPPAIHTYPPRRCVLFQFSSLLSVHGNLIPTV